MTTRTASVPENVPSVVNTWPLAGVAVVCVAGALALWSGTNSTSIEGWSEVRERSAWTNSGTSDVAKERRATPGPTPKALGPPSTAALVLELHRLSGLTWAQLASIFDVDRRAIHFWAAGRPMNAPNSERVAAVLALVRRVSLGDASATRAFLLTPTASGIVPIDALRSGNLDWIAAPAAVPAAPLKRPPQISAAARAEREPQPPEELLAGGDESRIGPARGRPRRPIPVRKKEQT